MPGISIDPSTARDNPAERQIDFVGDIDGKPYDFAVKYRALDVLAGRHLLEEPAAAFRHLLALVAEAALYAFDMASRAVRIVVDETVLLAIPSERRAPVTGPFDPFI